MAMAWTLLVALPMVAALRFMEPATTPLPGDPDVQAEYEYMPGKNPDTIAKFTDAESVEQVLFVLACKAKHKSDPDGMTRDAAKEQSFSEAEFQSYMKGLQDDNLAEMKETCGLVNSKATKKCHDDCTERWAKGGAASLPEKKAMCTEACTTKHTDWEAQCLAEVDNLQNVYVQEQGNLANTKKCQELHCKEFPAVLAMKDDEAEDHKKQGCKDSCTDKEIAAKCVKRWDLNLEYQMAQIQNSCQDETKSGTLEPCTTEGTGEIDTEFTNCKDEGKMMCDEKHQACLDEGAAAGPDSMVGAHAESICGTRKDNCYSNNDAKCMKKQSQALKKMEKKCKKKFTEKMNKCQDEKLKEAREKFTGECEKEIKPTCEEDCDKKCQIPDMRTCQEDMLKKGFGVSAAYCTKLWDWLFKSEQYDQKTMDPIPASVGGGRFKKMAPKRLQKPPE